MHIYAISSIREGGLAQCMQTYKPYISETAKDSPNNALIKNDRK